MATEVFINIKDLPELSEVSNGDYILLENATGTHIIDFKNFILPSANTLITATVNQNISAITDLSTNVSGMSTTLLSSIDKNTTDINTLSTKITSTSLLYLGKTKISINVGSREASNVLSPINSYSSLITTDDIIIVPANEYASKFPVVVSNVDPTTSSVTIKGLFTRKSITSTSVLTLSSLLVSDLVLSETEISAEQVAIYNVFAIKAITS